MTAKTASGIGHICRDGGRIMILRKGKPMRMTKRAWERRAEKSEEQTQEKAHDRH